MQAMADVFEEGDKTAPVISRETVLHAIEFMRYMLKCKLALLGETGEQPETPTITQPIQQHNAIFNTNEPEEFFKTHAVYISKALHHSKDCTVASSFTQKRAVPPVTDSEGKRGATVTNSWLRALESVQLGKVTLSGNGALFFRRYTWDDLRPECREYLEAIGVSNYDDSNQVVYMPNVKRLRKE